MKYFITPDADAISEAEAKRRGCVGTTTKWWTVHKHPTTGDKALSIPDTDVSKLPLNAKTIDALPTGWVPPKPKLP